MAERLKVGTENLLSELRSWNRQESQFRELFTEEAMKDREFLKMKLGVYAGLYHKYEGNVSTTDDKALLLMLRFQKQKMEKQLYPGLLRRMFNRLVKRFSDWLSRPAAGKPQPADTSLTYITSSLPVKDDRAESKQDQAPRQRYGVDLGRRNNNSRQVKHRL